MRLELPPYIERDLEAIADWIAQDNPRGAVRFIQEIREELLRIGEGPLLYQLRPEIGPMRGWPWSAGYVILFRIAGEVVRIERVVFGGRDLPRLM